MWVCDDYDLQNSFRMMLDNKAAYYDAILDFHRWSANMFSEYSYKKYLKYQFFGGGGGGSSSGRTGTNQSGNGISLRNRILNEKKTELDGMVKWTSENKREIGCLITMDENGVIHFVDVRTASKQDPHTITWWDPKIPEGHTYIGSFHTHTTSPLFSGADFESTKSALMTFESRLGAFSIDIMICPNGNDFKLHSVVIDNRMRETYSKWVWDDVCNGNSLLPHDSPNTIYNTFKKNNFNMNWGYYRSDRYKLDAPYRPYPRGILPPP